MRCVMVSDIHGNLEAFRVFEKSLQDLPVDNIIILGDIIDYGPHSNEVISRIKAMNIPIVANIRGNHELVALSGDGSRLSSDRGRNVAAITAESLDDESWDYIKNTMHNTGMYEFNMAGYSCLAVHGSIEDEYWGKLNGASNLAGYEKYDYVFSGHSHIPHYFEYFYPCDKPEYRNKKKTVFVNPGSLGQPRNHCPLSQYALIDFSTGEVSFIKNKYDIKKEQDDFDPRVDTFYKDRLELGL